MHAAGTAADPTTELVTGGKAAIAGLQAAGVDVVFGIPGVHTLALYDALHDAGIRHVLARHEQGAGFMADGYARATGRPGVAVIITGPGITNVATPVGEAYADSSPVVILSSQVEREWAGAMRGNLHDIRDQSGLMSILTKRSVSVTEHSAVVQQVFDVVTESQDERPRPMHIEIPLDVLAEVGPLHEPAMRNFSRKSADATSIKEAVTLLAGAQKPVIYVGGGALDASAEVIQLAELLGAPVICSVMGKGVVPDDHAYGLGHAWNPWGSENPANDLLAEADVAIIIGSKLGAQETNFWAMPLPATRIRIDIDAHELEQNYPNPTIALQGDAQATTAAIVGGLRASASTGARGFTPAEVAAYRERVQAQHVDETYGPYVTAVRDALPRDGIIVQDMTMMSYRMNDAFASYEPRTYLFPSTYGTLGFSVPAAIGAKVGQPDRAVVAVVGDGGFQFTMQELATALQFEVSLPIIIFNDSTYTAVDQAMRHSFDGKVMATDLINPDYVKLADAYGIPGVRAQNADELRDAIATALAHNGPTIIDVPIPRYIS